MAEPPAQEPDWFKKFKELNTKAADASATPRAVPRPGDPAERRRHVRFDLDATSVTLYRDGLLSLIGMGKENKAKVAVNLSEGGLQAITRERLAAGTKVKIRLEMEKFKDAIEAPGVVRWCFQNSKRKDDFHVGIQFDELPPAEARKIASMREWFTSPSLRAAKTRIGQKKGDGLEFRT
jgi:Tfp pilus assembly protein PilZ